MNALKLDLQGGIIVCADDANAPDESPVRHPRRRLLVETLREMWMEQEIDPFNAAREAYQSADFVFKLSGWMLFIGTFQYIVLKTHSWVAFVIEWILKSTLLLFLFLAVKALSVGAFGITWKFHTRRKRFLMWVVLPLITYGILSAATDSLVKTIAASR